MQSSNKTRILSLVFALPGVHMRQIQRILGFSFSSVRYNVESHKKNREVLRWNESGRSRLFPPQISEWEKVVYSHLRNRASRKVLRVLAQNGKLTNRELSRITGFAKSTLSECIRRLLDAGILTKSFACEGGIAFQLRDPERLVPMIRAADRSVLEEASDRLIELWDF